MIEIQVKDIVEVMPVLQELRQQTCNGITAFKIARLLKAIEQEFQVFEAARLELINKYAERDENNQVKVFEQESVKIKDEYLKQCTQELNEVLNSKITLNAEKIRLEEIADFNFAINQMEKLQNFIEY